MARKLFLAGCWVMILTGGVHLLGHWQMMHMPTQGASPEETQLLGLMRSFRDPGTGRSTLELMLGFSLMFSLFDFGLGIGGLLAGPSRRAAVFGCVVTGAALVVSLLYFFAAPSTCLGLAFAAFLAAALLL